MKLDSKYKFLIAGGSNTAITFTLYALLVHNGINYNLALAVTYVLGIVLGFLINRVWTFASNGADSSESILGSEQKPVHTQFGLYILVYALIFVVNFSILNLLVQAFQLDPIISQLFAIAVSTVCSYVLQKSWVFKHKDV